ncbi:MAG: TPR end-of-group domain-containing protein, partial [Candidatus Acidiferrales bacterium]
FEMATGKFPFSGKTGFEVSAAILREPPQQLPPKVPAGLRSIIGRCLAKEPAQRYQRAGELRAAVEAISSDSAAAPVGMIAEAGVKPSTGPIPTLTVEEPRRLNWLVWVGAALALGLLGFSWYQGFLSGPANDTASSVPAAPQPPADSVPRVSTGGKASPNPAANSYFEKATLFMRGQFDVPRARELLEKALETDPKFAEARSVYALSHLLQIEGGLSNDTAWLYRAEQQLHQALRDDPACDSVHAVRAALYVLQGKKELGRQLEAVFESDTQLLPGRVFQVHYHRMSGDYPTGIAMARETLQLMPVFFISQALLGNMLHETGDPAGAVREFTSVLDQDAQNIFALRELARGHIETGDTKTARIFLGKIRETDRRNYRVRLVWALLYAREGKRRDAQREMDIEVQKYAEVNPIVTLEAAEFYAILGDKAKALHWLERAVRNGDERIEWFQRDPLLESIRGEFRFKSLLDSIAYRRQQLKQ